MSRLLTIFSAFLALMLITACGDRTSIQTGEVGKVLTSKGLEDEIRQPGVFRMDWCGTAACPKLVRAQVNKSAVDIQIDSLFLPESNVDLTNVQAGIQFRVKQDAASINTVFAEVRPVQAATIEGNQGESDRVLIITTDMIWDTFGKRKAPDAMVSALREYTIDEVLVNVPEIAEFTKRRMNEVLADTPIEVTEFGFPNGIGQVPDAVLGSKRQLFAIEDEKARKVKSLEADLAVAEQEMAVARVRAKNDKTLAAELGMPVAQYQCLRAMDAFADASSDGANIAFAASCGLGSSAILR